MSEQPPGTPPPPGPPGGFPPPSGPPPGPPSGPPSGPPPVYQPPSYAGQVVGAVPQSQKSVLALVLGILSCVCCPILGPVAFFIGRQAMAEIDGSGGTLSGRGLAQAGFILGIIGSAFLVLAVLYWVVVILILGAAFTTHVNTVTP
jgi:hypothetical protein